MARAVTDKEKSNTSRRALLLGLAILVLFAVWTSTMRTKSYVNWDTCFSLFFRNYQQYGLAANHLLPAYNFQLTNPPSGVYLSISPLVPLVMYVAATVFGDNPSTYYGVIIAVNVTSFGLLSLLVGRWWGARTGLWALFFSALSTYALRHGALQTPEHLSVLGMFSAIFLYFEWLETKQTRFLILCALTYLVGFAADYLAFFSALVICAHWLVFVRNKIWAEFLKMSTLPALTLGYTLLMMSLMLASGLQLQAWIGRAVARATGPSWYELVYALLKNVLVLLGPGLVGAAIVFFVWKHWRRGDPVESSLELGLLYSLLISGLLPIIVFRQAYINHPEWTMFLVPFFAVSGALAVGSLLKASMSSWRKYFVLFAVVLGFLAPSLRDAGRLVGQFLAPPPPGRAERIARLSQIIKPDLHADDELVVLFDHSDDWTYVTAFYVLWIPTSGAGSPDRWEYVLKRKGYSLILTTNSGALDLVERLGQAEMLAADGEIAFFRAQP